MLDGWAQFGRELVRREPPPSPGPGPAPTHDVRAAPTPWVGPVVQEARPQRPAVLAPPDSRLPRWRPPL